MGDCFAERNESMPEGELISVTINEGIKKFSELGRHNNSNKDKTKYKKVCISDIAYNSMRMWQGASGYSPYEGIVSPAYTVLVPNAGIDSKCLSYQIKLPYMIHIFQINSQGITSDNWNLKYPVLSQIEIFISKNIEEQRKISNLFDNLDNLITLHQRKYFCSNNLIFTITTAWEQRKLGEIADFFKGNGLSWGDVDENGVKECILYGNLYTDYGMIATTVKYKTNKQISNPVYSEYRDVLIPASDTTPTGLARATSIEKAGILLGGDINIIRPHKEMNGSNISLAINANKSELIKLIKGITVRHIHNTDLKNVNIFLSKSELEQEYIVEIFKKFDNLITLHQRECFFIKKEVQNVKFN